MQATQSPPQANHTQPNKKVPTRAELEKEVRKTIHDIECALSDRHTKPKKEDLTVSVDRLLLIVRKVGAEPDDLVVLVDLAAYGKLSARLAYRILQCLIPRTFVPWIAAVKAVSWLCVGHLQPSLQVVLIKWIAAVFYELDCQEQLHALYDMLFFYLEDGKLCQPIAELLYHLTRREDVRHHHIKKLMHLKTKMGSPVKLVALLQLFKLFQPNLVFLPNEGRKQYFTFNADSMWTPWITNLHAASSQLVRNLTDKSKRTLALKGKILRNFQLPKLQDVEHHQKRAKRDLFQRSGQHSLLIEVEESMAVPLEQIRSFQELLHYIDRVQLPSQMSTALRNHEFHILLGCHPNHDAKIRLDLWLQHSLNEAFIQSPGRYSDDYRRQLLVSVVQFQDYLQCGLPSTSRFLVKYLYRWNWQDFQPLILNMIPHFCVVQFEDLRDFILTPLRNAFLGSSLKFKVLILKRLMELMTSVVESGCYGEDNGSSYSSRSCPDSMETFDTIAGLADFVSCILQLGLEIEEDHVLLMHLALKFYQLMTDLPQKYNMPILPLIPLPIARKALLAIDAMTISRLCNLACRYKSAITYLKKRPPALLNEHTQRSLMQIETFNSLLLEISNALWRNKAFETVSPTTVTFGISTRVLKSVKASHKQEAFSIYRHIAFVGYALGFQHVANAQSEEKAEVANPRHLFFYKPEAKDVYLEFLRRQRLSGISEFVKEFIKRKKTSSTSKNSHS